jgi:hypothetical protein
VSPLSARILGFRWDGYSCLSVLPRTAKSHYVSLFRILIQKTVAAREETRTFVLRGGELNGGREQFAAARMNGVAESVQHFATPTGSPGCRHFTGISQVLMRTAGASFFSDFSDLAQTMHLCCQCL